VKSLSNIVGMAVVVSACGPADDAVRTAEEAARIAHEKCYKAAPMSAWHSERGGDFWFARLGNPEASSCWHFTARIKAIDGNAVCEVNLCRWGGR